MARILVGVHRSAAAGRALEWAADTALRQEALLHVVTVITPGWAPSGYEGYFAALPDALREASLLQAAFIENVVGVQSDVRVRRDIVVGASIDRLVALSEGADLLVVGRRSRRLAGIDWWPRTARGCARASLCPVVIVHERDAAFLPEPLSSVPFSMVDRLVEGRDGLKRSKVYQLPHRRCRRRPQVHTDSTLPRLSE
jgi:nucleotide-binding universal stress UspA family protein